jgi:adenosylcobinamide-GDP ribazoletransferase
MIGWVVGAAIAVVMWACGLILPAGVAVIIGLGFGVLLTGAFHEDGFADVCDGFGGGTSRERTLEIMKDSRVGAFALIGTVLLFALKIAAWSGLVAGPGWWWAPVGLVYAHVLSRWCVVTIIFADSYARADLTSKVKPIGKSISIGGLGVATVWLIPFIVVLGIWQPWWLLAIPIGLLIRFILGAWFRQRLGGYTGDCLGAAQQVIETFTALTLLAILGLSH